MMRTQLSLDPLQYRRARARAAELGISLAEYLRRLIARDLDPQERPASDISVVFALGDSGGSDVAGSKDGYLADALTTRQDRNSRS